MRFILVLAILLLASPSFAEEKYSCFLDKRMEVGNDGSFNGPEKIEIRLRIIIQESTVYIEGGKLTLLNKDGTARFAANGGIASTETIHVWRREKSDKYDIQYSNNYEGLISIKTGVCIRD